MEGTKPEYDAREIIDLLGYPAILINKRGIITAINKEFRESFFCRTNNCMCDGAKNEIILEKEGRLCSTFFLASMELFINYPSINKISIFRKEVKWKLNCRSFDKDVWLIYATDNIAPDEVAQKLENLTKEFAVSIPESMAAPPYSKKNILEIPLSEFEIALNKAFFLIQDSRVIYYNELFKQAFQVEREILHEEEIENLLGRPVQYFKTICDSSYNKSPMEVDLHRDEKKRSYNIIGRKVFFNNNPAYAIVLEFLGEKKEGFANHRQRDLSIRLPQSEYLDWKSINIELDVLCVEDKLVNQKILKLMLENIGCNVDVANNGKEGIDMILRKRYDIVFMDIQMPVMDGLTASRKILGFNDPPPIVAVTANFDFMATIDMDEFGFKDIIAKPVSSNELYEKLLYWVQ